MSRRNMNVRIVVVMIGLLAAPLACYPGIIVTGSLTREYEVAPGRTYEGSIDVKNPEKTPQEIKVYQTDYFFYADGKVLYGDPGALPRSNARWMTLSPQQVTVPPNETVSVHFSVQVPNDTTLKGTYWSVVMVEPVAEGSAESSLPGPKNTGVGVSQVLRYAVQIVTHVGATGTRLLKFSRINLVRENENKLLLVDIENTGERWLRGALWAELYDSKGSKVGRFDGGKQRMYPGTSVRFTVDLIGVQDPSYKALIVVDCGNEDVFGANVTLVLKQ
jgi:hypothetical protein